MGIFSDLLKKADEYEKKRNEAFETELAGLTLPIILPFKRGKHRSEDHVLIDENGITLYFYYLLSSEKQQIGPVAWQDISEISREGEPWAAAVWVRNAEEYLEGKKLKKSEILRRNQMDLSGLVFKIEAKSVDMAFDELLYLLRRELDKRPNSKYNPENEELDWIDAEENIFED